MGYEESKKPYLKKERMYPRSIKRGKESSSIIDMLADKVIDKVLSKSDLYILDFRGNSTKEVFIDRVNYLNNTLKLKQPIKLSIEKKEEGFLISQNLFSIKVFDNTFSKALENFQKEFYLSYLSIKASKSSLRILYNSVIDKNRE